MNTWNEYGKWVTKGDNEALAEARQQLIASCKAHGLIIIKDLPNEVEGNKERPVVAIKDRGVNMTKDYKKLKAYLVQELKDVKAKLKRMKIKDAVSDWHTCKEDAKRLFKMGFTIAEALDSINRKWYGIMSPSDQKAVVLSVAKDMGIKDTALPKFEESKHKRDKDGKFSSTGGGGKNTEESDTGKKSVLEMSKSRNKAEKKKIAKAYWKYFLNGVDDLVDFAEGDEELSYYAEDGDIDGMASVLGNSEGGIEAALEAIKEYDEDEIKKLEKVLNEDTAIKDYKIELMINGKKIGIVNASSPSEAVNRYEREHPELKGKVDGILVVDAVYKILKDSISYDKAEAERLFGLGYSAREVAMKNKEYQLSDNHSEQMDLIKRLENHRKEFFKEMMAKKRAGRI